MIHFWREVSLAGLPLAGPSQDECYALLFESAFDLAEAEPEWALECLAEKSASVWSVPLGQLAHQIAGPAIDHSSIAAALTSLYAPLRERDPQKWSNELIIAFLGDVLFWTAIFCAGSVEQKQVLRFLNAQCIRQGFESEEDCFGSDLTLAQWVRDAREWACNMLATEPETCEELFDEAGEKALDRTRMFYHEHLGTHPAQVDSLDATAALMKWANQRRGFQYSQYRAQRWEFVVEIADAALWLGWLFPDHANHIVPAQTHHC